MAIRFDRRIFRESGQASWRMEMDKFPTGEALRKRNIMIEDSTCPLCGSDEETSEHLFISCSIAFIVWNGVSSWCKIPNIFVFSITDLLGILAGLRVSEKKKEAVQGIIMLVVGVYGVLETTLNFLTLRLR
ncbi:uncharacterized protein LOC118490414 [Helianthus annuus]|uniref:uncharacterized protein LOC118490414 n=1 Tax=Helianthus annuus TaxID=4232 RepID=UPI001652FD89|nr:uncharacterized protein LOC118490414 [Helianthus annuus]